MSRIRVAMTALVVLTCAARSTIAANWDGGSGTWSTTVGKWDGGSVWSQGSSAVFNASPGTVTLGENISASTLAFNVANGFTVNLNGFNLTLTGSITGHNSHTITNTSATTATVTATEFEVPTLAGNLNVTKIGSAAWNTTVPNSFTGKLTLQGGNTIVVQDNNLGAAHSITRLENGAQLTLNTNDATTGDGDPVATETYTHDIEVASGYTGRIEVGNNWITLSGDISGAGTLTRGGQGQLILAGDNSGLTGNIAFFNAAGTIIAASDTALGTGSGTIAMQAGGASGMTIGFQGGVNVGAKSIQISQALGADGKAQIHSFSGNNTFGGNIEMNSTGANRFGAEANSSLKLTGKVFGTSSREFHKIGPGTVELAGLNYYRGMTVIHNGTLAIGINAPNGPGGTTQTDIGALGNFGSLTLGGASSATTDNIALIITGPFEMERAFTVTNANSGGITTIGGSNTSGTAAFTGAITLQRSVSLTAAPGGQVDFRPDTSTPFGQPLGTGIISGAHNINIVGGGTVRLAAKNTYIGTTTVSAGELLVNGDPVNQGNYFVNSGARLGGTGIIGLASGNSVTVAGNPGAISPGDAGYIPSVTTPGLHAASASYSAGLDPNTVDTLTINGDVNLGGFLLLDVISDTTADLLVVGGELSLDDTTSKIEINGQTDFSLLDFGARGFAVGDRLNLVDANSIAGDFMNISLGQTIVDAGGLGIVLGNDGGLLYLQAVQVQALPEPASVLTWTFAAIATFAALVARREKRK